MDQKQKFIAQIALGMLHLHKEKVIHRDLAVRNILLSKHLDAKVADFGLSREQEDTDVMSQTTSTVGPVKWMAPEAISHRQYSTNILFRCSHLGDSACSRAIPRTIALVRRHGCGQVRT